MKDYLEIACEDIDSAIFSSDALYDDEVRAELKAYVGRWHREIAQHEAIMATESDDGLTASDLVGGES